MNRRNFVRLALPIGAGVLGAAGALGHRAHARSRLSERLLGEAFPILLQKDAAELRGLPVEGAEEIRRYFHGKCLKVAGYVQEISSFAFQEKLRLCGSDEIRQECLLVAFCGSVVMDAEILLLFRVAPVARLGAKVLLPIFVMTAFYHVARYLLGLFAKPDLAPYQKAISGELANLGNRVAQEFAQELKGRIADLHRWQETAVRVSADEEVNRRMPLWGWGRS